MKTDRTKVREVTMKRYFIYGKGYNSSLAAHMQIAKRAVQQVWWDTWRDSGKPIPSDSLEFEFWATRYPARQQCRCMFCSGHKIFGTRLNGRGCWVSRMADYRQIAREIISGERAKDGTLL